MKAKGNIKDIYALTPTQEGMYFHSLYDKESRAYVLQTAYRMHGNLRADLAERSLNELFQRHDILRTAFIHEGFDRTLQVVLKDRKADFYYADLTAFSTEEKKKHHLDEFKKKDIERSFNLNKDVLMRIAIFKINSQEFEFIWSHHHIIMDGWCTGLLSVEFYRIYNSLLENKPLSLPAVTPYVNYIKWLEKQDHDESKKYWFNYLQEYNEIATVPYSNTVNSGKKEYLIEQINLFLSAEKTQALSSLAAKQNTTLNIVMQTLWAILLGKYKGNKDVVFGAVVSGRPSEIEGVDTMVGLFINTLPVRISFEGVASFDALLKQVHDGSLDNEHHNYFPLAEIQAQSSLKQKLLDHIFTFENFPVADQIDGIGSESESETTVSNVEIFDQNNYNFNITIVPRKELFIRLLFNKNAHDIDSIHRVKEHLQQLIDQILDNPKAHIDDLSVLDVKEFNKVIDDFNFTEEFYSHSWTIQAEFERRVISDRNAVALSFSDWELSYGDLNEKANQLGHHLRDTYGVLPGDLVGVMLDRSEHMVIAILGILKAGGAYLPMDPGLPTDRLNYMMKDTDICTLLTQSDYLYRVGSFSGKLFAMDVELDALQTLRTNPSKVNKGSDLAYVIYTSGSTGVPKGVMVEHKSVCNLAYWQGKTFGIGESSGVLQFFSYSFDGAVGETFMALLNGGRLCMYTSANVDPQDLVSFINAQAVTVGVFVPSLLRQISPLDLTFISSLTVVSVGEACPVALANEWSSKCRFINAYGPTEYTVYSHLHQVSSLFTAPSRIPIGRSIFNTKTYILDKDHQPVPIGVKGELYLSGGGLGRGYLNQRLLTLSRFLPNRFFLSAHYQDHGLLVDSDQLSHVERFKASSKPQHYSRTIREFSELKSSDELLRLTSVLDQDIQVNTRLYINENIATPYKYEGFYRYFIEGLKDSYSSSGFSANTLLTLFKYNDFAGKRGIDFGFGSGEVLSVLQQAGADVQGIELSPYAVQRARSRGHRAHMGEADLTSALFMDRYKIAAGSQDFSISTLLLDRVENPVQLLENMFFVLCDGGRFSVQTLLPIIPVDDGNHSEKIVYTSEAHRLTLGESLEADKLKMVEVLYRLGGRDIEIYELPLCVNSSDGVQQYSLWSFTGRKLAIPVADDEVNYSLMYKTGDLVRWNSDGSIDYIGREDSQIKLRGFRIELEEIERVLQQHPLISESVVVVRHCGQSEKEIVCYYRAVSFIRREQLDEHLKSSLPFYMIPSYYVALDSFPLTVSGKIDKHSLPVPGDDGRSSAYVGARNATESQLVSMWEEILDRQSVGVTDNFFELGGHSLKATRLTSRIYKDFGTRVELSYIFDHPTIEALAIEIARQRPEKYESIRVLEVQQDYAASHSQKRLWVIDQLETGKMAYVIPGAYRIDGPLNKEAFGNSFDLLVDRHESLRTTFLMRGGELRQRIHSRSEIGFKVEFEALPPGTEAPVIQQLCVSESERGFDLSTGPLLRARIIALNEERHLFLLTMHHIIADGWSMEILVREVLNSYNSLSEGKEVVLPALPIQYKEYAAWQNEQLTGERLEQHRSYWLEQFKDGVPLLQLPTDYQRPAVRTINGEMQRTVFNKELKVKLNDYSQVKGVSLFMTLTTVVKVLLYRYTGQTDIVVGSPIAGRSHYDLENQIGFYLNNICLRSRFNPTDRFDQVLLDLKQTTLNAYAYQQYPFDKLVEDLNLDRDLSRSPLFDVAVVLQNTELCDRPYSFNKILVSGYDYGFRVSPVDLRIEFIESGDGLIMHVDYNKDLFSDQRIDRMLGHFQELLQSVLTDDSQSVCMLNYLTEREREHIRTLHSAPLLTDSSGRTIVDIFEAQVALTPQAVAVKYREKTLTYTQLNERADRVSNYLRGKYNVQPNDIVGLMVERTELSIIAIMGILKAGAAYLPIDPSYPSERIAYIITDSKLKLLITETAYIFNVPFYDGNLFAIDVEPEYLPALEVLPPVTLCPCDLAYVIYTSGSTGHPKGVMIEHRSNVNMSLDQIERFGVSEQDNILQFASLSFDASVYELFMALYKGAAIVIVDKEIIQNPTDFIAYIHSQEVSIATLPPSYLSRLPLNQLTSLRVLITAGEAAIVGNAVYCSQFVDYYNAYGPTECAVCTSVYKVSFQDSGKTNIPIGKPIANTVMYLLDENMNDVAIGVDGNIYVSGMGLARGYLNRADLTEKAFVFHPLHPNTRLYKTGDVGRRLDTGDIEFRGRKDAQVKIRGHRIEAGEIENTLLRFEGVEDVAVIVKPADNGDKFMIAYLQSSRKMESSDLRAYLSDHLPEYMIPSHFVTLEKLPLTTNGKVDHKKLANSWTTDLNRATGYVAPRNELEEELVLIWENVLKTKNIGVNDNFFELGGNSLKLIELHSHFNGKFESKITMPDLFKYTTINSLHSFLKKDKAFKQPESIEV